MLPQKETPLIDSSLDLDHFLSTHSPSYPLEEPAYDAAFQPQEQGQQSCS